MPLFDLSIRGVHSAMLNEEEVRQRLEQYRRDNPDDPAFTKVTVVEINESADRASVGTSRSVFEFIDE